ncbi:MAG: 2OG-Fe(II) oxygenase [Acidobacteriota bacterium]|nr:2OG-Fe(II) oxygenase [Acidobacteriota bacterium]MDH3528089.1 2OG-Fe(II) oxygenase [Acidobacteriota bacterium]
MIRNLDSAEDIVDEQIKKRSEVSKPKNELVERVTGKLNKLRPLLEKSYNLKLTGVQPPKFCLYETGDYYRFHIDAGEYKNIGEYATPRKVSAIVFLNEESQVPMEGKYSGGNLTFYGLMQKEAFSKFGLPLVGEEGMLITFPPNLGHEVTEVTSGERYTIATWFV